MIAEIIYPHAENIVSILRSIKENSAEAKAQGSFLTIDDLPEDYSNEQNSIYVTAFLHIDDVPQLISALEQFNFEIIQTNCLHSIDNEIDEEGLIENSVLNNLIKDFIKLNF